MVGKTGMTWTSTETISEARRLRMLGRSYEEIKEATGLHMASISRYCSDIKLPKTTAQVTATGSKYAREQKRADIDSKRGSVNYPVTEEPEPEWLPDAMPTDASEFDLTGLFPDKALVSWAHRVQKRYIEDKARGKLFFGVPIEVIKAQIVTSTTLMPWSPEWMLDSRNQWEAVRLFTTLSNEDLAERAGISGSSLSRYSKGMRTPSKGDLERIRIAMWAAMEDRLYNLDLWLCLEDFTAAHGLDEEDEYEFDDALRWISGVGDTEEGDPQWSEELTLDHLPSLRHIRSLMPYPAYRDSDSMLFDGIGYAGYEEEVA